MDEEMGLPCEQKEAILSMKGDVIDVKGDIKELVSEFKELARDLRSSLVANGQLQTKVETLIKDLDELWHEHRGFTNDMWDAIDKNKDSIIDLYKTDVQPLKEWKGRIDDRFATLKIIPIVCTVITIIITLYNILHKAGHGPATLPGP
jgi:archaellum component FlaC